MADGGCPIERVFNLQSPFPITLSASLSISEDDLRAHGIPPLFDCSSVRIGLTLKRDPNGARLHVEEFCFHGEADLRTIGDAESQKRRMEFAESLAAAIAANASVGHGRFVLLDTTRRLRHDAEQAKTPRSQVIPDSVALALWDAKESNDRDAAERWRLFKSVVEGVVCTDAAQQVIVVYDRKHDRAQLMVETPQVRIPFSLLGTGFQQLAGLVAQLLLCGADVVAIEEPEINLRHTLQKRLRDIFAEVTAAPVGPRQIILTSHSPAFETGREFYLMESSPEGPVVVRRPVREAAQATGYDASGRYQFLNDAQFNTLAGITDDAPVGDSDDPR